MVSRIGSVNSSIVGSSDSKFSDVIPQPRLPLPPGMSQWRSRPAAPPTQQTAPSPVPQTAPPRTPERLTFTQWQGKTQSQLVVADESNTTKSETKPEDCPPLPEYEPPTECVPVV